MRVEDKGILICKWYDCLHKNMIECTSMELIDEFSKIIGYKTNIQISNVKTKIWKFTLKKDTISSSK